MANSAAGVYCEGHLQENQVGMFSTNPLYPVSQVLQRSHAFSYHFASLCEIEII